MDIIGVFETFVSGSNPDETAINKSLNYKFYIFKFEKNNSVIINAAYIYQ